MQLKGQNIEVLNGLLSKKFILEFKKNMLIDVLSQAALKKKIKERRKLNKLYDFAYRF